MKYIYNIENLVKGDYILIYEQHGDITTSHSCEKGTTIGQFSHLTKIKRIINYVGYNYHRSVKYRSSGISRSYSYYIHKDCHYGWNHSRGNYRRTVYRLTEEEALLHMVVDKL